jgi:hypothetical protein
MTRRSHRVVFLLGIVLSFGASYPTTNFVVDAPTPQFAEVVGKWAEYYRQKKAIEWLGREMPNWSTPCPIHVKVTAGGASGATSFSFSGGGVWQTMEIEGPPERLINSVLPHEITHTVFAHYFGAPVPRWADEGGAVLSEDDLERNRHDAMVRQILNASRSIPLNRLFTMKEYPRSSDGVGALYAQGYSVSDYLVHLSSRQVFLQFVAHGMQSNFGWDNAARTYYRFQSVNELEQSWLAHLRSTKKQPANSGQAILAKNDKATQGDPAKRVVFRDTAPPAEPLADNSGPTIRMQAPETDNGWTSPARAAQRLSRPDYLPEPQSKQPLAISRDQWQPPAAHLGSPQFGLTSGPPAQQPAPRQQIPGTGSPIGYPY